MDKNTVSAVAQVTTDPSWKEAAMISGAALLGSFLRYQQWLDVKGRFIWWKFAFDIPGSIAFGVISIGVGRWWFGDNVDFWRLGAIAGFLGMLGPSAVKALVAVYIGGGRSGTKHKD